MFGYVTANVRELTKEEKARYNAIYCGICRQIGSRSGTIARISLRYDMAFLAALLMSLYEPEESQGRSPCLIHPLGRKPWVNSDIIGYCADMNVALGYYHFLDDWNDDGKYSAKLMADMTGTHMEDIASRWPRQCHAIEECIARLSRLEGGNCPNPDEPAACFGALMAELFVYQDDLWAPTLRRIGDALGRFVYLLDGALDYRKDQKKGKYNPYLAMGQKENWQAWEEYLVLTMGRCTDAFERLPLVQDKALLDNILYSGVWINYRGKRKEADQND